MNYTEASSSGINIAFETNESTVNPSDFSTVSLTISSDNV